MRLRTGSPCLVLSGETGENYIGVVVEMTEDTVTVEHRTTKEQTVLEHTEVVPAQWSTDGKRKKGKRCKSR